MKDLYFKVYLALLIFLLLSYPFYSQKNQSAVSIAKSANELITKAIQDYQKKDYIKSAELFEEALKIKPDHPFIMYNVAAVNALLDNKPRALEILNNLTKMKLIYHPELDSDFISLWDNDYFNEAVDKFNSNSRQTGKCDTAFQLNEKDLITEGINYYPKAKKFYISSIRKRKIISVDENGNAEDFITTGKDGIWGIFGMAVDSKNGILWVATSAVPEIENYNKTDSGKTGVFKYDLAAKKLIKKYLLDDGGNHLFGDLTLSPTGEIFISDSRSNSVYMIDHKKDQLEKLLQSDDFVSQQGITLSKDNAILFLADYAFGIYKINILTKEVTKLSAPDSICMLGIDGMYFYDNSVIAVQNGINPNRIVRLYLNNDANKIENYEILAANIQPIEDPTLGVIKGNNFYFIANSQWSKIDKNGLPLPYDKWDVPTVLKISLTR